MSDIIRPLKTGVAYHGNRILSHVSADMDDIVRHNMNLVVHMFTHNDMERHRKIMAEIIGISEAAGLEVWIDNWGLGGPPGEVSHFLAYHPEAHQVFSTGEPDPIRACYNHPSFRAFTHEWLDCVAGAGGKHIFWDEPHLQSKTDSAGNRKFTCRCECCRGLFREKYGFDMPAEQTEEVERFRLDTIKDYFTDACDYAASLGMTNAVCVMLSSKNGICLDTLGSVCGIDSLSNIGSDPYWLGKKQGQEVYGFVHERTRQNLEVCERYGKEHNIWIQAYNTPAGREEEIIYAADAAYDAGARTILAWGYRGSESNDYRARNCEAVWQTTGEAMRRLRDRHRDEVRAAERRSPEIK